MATNIVAGTSKFKIYSSFTLSHDDVMTLSLLYTPLIGNDAFALYMAFSSMLERNNLKSEEIIHQDLFTCYSLKPIDFMQSKNKLEGIGLLLTYEKENSYIYVLLPPLSPKNFIKDAVYGLYLYTKVGKERYEFLEKHFAIEKPDKDSYVEITKSFDEVYKSKLDNDETFKKFAYLLGKNPTEYLSIKNEQFDFDKFVKEINLDFLESGIDDTFKNQIINLAFVYGFDEHQMASLYEQSINKNQAFDYRILKKKANTFFVFQRKMNGPVLVEKDAQVGSDTNLISWLENVTPRNLLNAVSPNYPPAYLETINDIYEALDNTLPRGVINCMIFKTVRDKGGDLPNVTYFKRTADTWISDSVLSTKDAVKYITTVKDNLAFNKSPRKNKERDNAYSSSNNIEVVWEEL